jgi:hypothetical protein
MSLMLRGEEHFAGDAASLLLRPSFMALWGGSASR